MKKDSSKKKKRRSEDPIDLREVEQSNRDFVRVGQHQDRCISSCHAGKRGPEIIRDTGFQKGLKARAKKKPEIGLKISPENEN